MPVFPSEEWAKTFVNALNASEEYAKAGAEWEGSMTFVMEAEPGKLNETVYFYTDPYHGKIREACLLKSLDEKPADFILAGKYSAWKEVMKGYAGGAVAAIMKGKIRIKGNMQTLMKNAKAAQVLTKIMSTVDTQFIDEVQK